MSQDQIESLSPELYSQFLSDGEILTNPYRSLPHSTVNVACENDIHSRITWV